MDELTSHREDLLTLYRSRGFERVCIPPFEEYALLGLDRFGLAQAPVTFMSAEGKLMALFADMTLSVIKGVPPQMDDEVRRLCYDGQVCRLSRETGEYRLISQVGLEIIDDGQPLSDAELVDVALDSLEVLGDRFALDLSHMGLVGAIFDTLGLTEQARVQAQDALRCKSPHLLDQALCAAGVDDDGRALMADVARAEGSLPQAISSLRALGLSVQAQCAIDELAAVCAALGDRQNMVRLDFSATGDPSYYTGIVLRGYLAGVSDPVLSGGRYDGLMRALSKKACACGLAVSLSYLESSAQSNQLLDCVGVYDKDCAPAVLLDWQRTQRKRGLRAGLCPMGAKNRPQAHAYMTITPEGAQEEPQC